MNAPAPRPSIAVANRRHERRLWVWALLIIPLLLVLPWLAWRMTPSVPLDVVILDKTLPHPRWREHERLTWWLSHRLIRTPDGRRDWDPARDYIGYDPVRRTETLLTDARLERAELVYIADAYGVYSGDLVDSTGTAHGDTISALERSSRIAGGMALSEVEALERFAARGGAVVAEFNTLEDPTSGTEAGERLGKLLGARYLRWLGRWYGDLSSPDEIPSWMRERHQRVFGRPWDRTGPGLVFFAELDDRLVVIDSSHFTGKWPVTLEREPVGESPHDRLVERVRDGRPYWYWMAATEPIGDATVLASWQLQVDSTAKRWLREVGFSDRIPAVVRRTGGPLRAYVTGDIADVGAALPPLKRTRFLDPFGRWNARGGRPGEQRDFFWHVTGPLWDGMLREVLARRSGGD